jgi:hypothetical protein
VYRPHIDGAWPPSGERTGVGTGPTNSISISSGSSGGCDSSGGSVNAQDTDNYIYDCSNGRLLSKFTFLIYLNEEPAFHGGGTTFYAPSATETGVLERRAVTPRTGNALIFPHGATSAALHEGSEVISGLKYVIRTEILFPVA